MEENKCYKMLQKTKTSSYRNKHKEARRNARSIALAQENTRQYRVSELVSTAGENVYSLEGCKRNGKIQAGRSRSKLCERYKWKSVGRK